MPIDERFSGVANDAEIADESLHGVSVRDVLVLLARSKGTIHAIGRFCTHEYADLAEGKLEDGCVVCPLHGSKFDLDTGEALTLPAFEPEPVYDVLVKEGVVYVAVDVGSDAT